ncbi:MAG: lysophospholipid acyltransferase family protein [Flavobacteriaceae bacterium]|nr:lysophospholipid acyltransferase family protein [Flavobacteriaceae bacterium]
MQRLLYLLIYPIMWFTSILPLWLLYFMSSVLFVLVYYVIGYRKKVVKSNLRLVFPEKSESEIKEISKKFYQHLCDMIFETIKNLTFSEKEAMKRFTFENLDLVEDLYRQGKSILLMCGHYSSWEWSGILNNQNPYLGFAVYKKMDNPHFDRLVRKIRERFGASIVTNTKIVSTLFRLHRKGEKTMTLILADQTPKLGAFKHRDTFMGIDVPVFTGTEELAKKLDFAALYLKITKVKRGYYSARFVPLAIEPKELEDYQITRLFLSEIEKQIKEKPEYYLWSHKRWKHRN